MNNHKYENQVWDFTLENKEYILTGKNHTDTLLCYFTKNRIYLNKELVHLAMYRLVQEEVYLFLREGKVIITF